MPGPVPGIHVFLASFQEDVDGRDKPGPDKNQMANARFNAPSSMPALSHA